MCAEAIFLNYSADKLRQLNGRIRDCFGRLDDDQVWSRGHENENAPANLVLHLCGNVRQWISTGIGGAPDTRARDAEFAARGGVGKEELLNRLDTVLEEALAVIQAIPPARLTETIRVQDYGITVLEAVYHVVEHFAQHTAQIIFATKIMTGQDLGYYGHLKRPHREKTP